MTKKEIAAKAARNREIQSRMSEIYLQMEKEKREEYTAEEKREMAELKQELEAPIYAKINAAIKEVGDAGRYTYIIDVSQAPVVYTGVGAIDLTRQVKKALGVD